VNVFCFNFLDGLILITFSFDFYLNHLYCYSLTHFILALFGPKQSFLIPTYLTIYIHISHITYLISHTIRYIETSHTYIYMIEIFVLHKFSTIVRYSVVDLQWYLKSWYMTSLVILQLLPFDCLSNGMLPSIEQVVQ